MEKFARHFFSRTTANTHTNMLRTRSTKHKASSTLAAAASKRVILSVSSSRTFVGSFEEEDFDDERRRGKMTRSRHQQLNPIGSSSSSSSSASSVKKSSFCRARFSTRSNTNDDIDNNTVIYFSPDSNGASYTLTLEGITDGDLSEISISAEDGEADSTVTDGGSTDTDTVDLSSGTVTATSANDVYEYTVKFVDGSPVALDGNVTIDGFNTNYDKIIIKAESIPAGFTKNSLLTAANVDIVGSSFDNTTTIYFAPDSDGTSNSITINGVNDDDLSSVSIEISSGSVTVTTTIDLST